MRPFHHAAERRVESQVVEVIAEIHRPQRFPVGGESMLQAVDIGQHRQVRVPGFLVRVGAEGVHHVIAVRAAGARFDFQNVRLRPHQQGDGGAALGWFGVGVGDGAGDIGADHQGAPVGTAVPGQQAQRRLQGRRAAVTGLLDLEQSNAPRQVQQAVDPGGQGFAEVDAGFAGDDEVADLLPLLRLQRLQQRPGRVDGEGYGVFPGEMHGFAANQQVRHAHRVEIAQGRQLGDVDKGLAAIEAYPFYARLHRVVSSLLPTWVGRWRIASAALKPPKPKAVVIAQRRGMSIAPPAANRSVGE